jgi:hypothetical protein
LDVRYMLLIYGDESEWSELGQEESAAEMAKWVAYGQEIESEGILRGGDALHPTAAATTVRVRDGETQVTDGPFAETREHLGGYYMLECDGLDQAIDAARRIPSVGTGSVEVRPIMEFDA